MAKDVPLGMEFMNWQNLPSLTESFAKMAAGGAGSFNPLGYAIGYGLDKAMGGENDYLSTLIEKQKQAIPSQIQTPVVPNSQPAPAYANQPAVPNVQSVAPQSPVDQYIPSLSGLRAKVYNILGGQ